MLVLVDVGRRKGRRESTLTISGVGGCERRGRLLFRISPAGPRSLRRLAVHWDLLEDLDVGARVFELFAFDRSRHRR